jgi:hypothetical protein
MAERSIPPGRTLAILLGAAEFPDSTLEGSVAFSNAAAKVSNYLLDESGFALPGENLLSLFNLDHSPYDLDRSIYKFLTQRIEETNQTAQPVSDLIIYYVGHGFFDENQDYRLAIRRTADRNMQVSSLAITALNTTITSAAPKIRTYFLLAACSSVEAARQYQWTADTLLKQPIRELPATGAAFLCSSSAKAASQITARGDDTVFSESLVYVLWNGSDCSEGPLTLENLKDATTEQILKSNVGSAVRPELHVPNQAQGNISSTIGLFPNNPRQVALNKVHRDKVIEEIKSRKERNPAPLENPPLRSTFEQTNLEQQELEERKRVQEQAEESKLLKDRLKPLKVSKLAIEEAEQAWDRGLSGELIMEWLIWRTEQLGLDKNILEYQLESLNDELRNNKTTAANVHSHYEAQKKTSSDELASLTYQNWAEWMEKVGKAEKSIKQQEFKIALAETTCRTYRSVESDLALRRLLLRLRLYRKAGKKTSVAEILQARSHRARALTSLKLNTLRIVRKLLKITVALAILLFVLWWLSTAH